jgi:hypothetical protein
MPLQLKYLPVPKLCNFVQQVLRTRMQDTSLGYKRLRDSIVSIWQTEGIRGYYRGLILGTLKVLPNSIVIFYTYESVIEMLRK